MQRPSFSIYDASAGSGKTYALVKEYLKIILTSEKHDAYRHILAITFTNKAVHEMKSRIVKSLSEFSKPEPDAKAAQLMQVLSVETDLTVFQIRTKSQQIIKHLIHNYAAFDISTIDKFTHKVIRAFARDLNLPMTFEVSLDTENLLTEAVDAIIAQAGEDPTLTKLLVDFTMEKTDDDKSWDISREIMETGRLVLNENHRSEIMHFQDKTIAEFVAIKQKLNEACKGLEEECGALGSRALKLIEERGINLASFSAGHFPNHLGYIHRGELKNTHKKYRSSEDIKINKNASDSQLIEAVLPEMLNILDNVYQRYEKKDFYRAFLKNITPLSLLNTVSNELAKIQKEQNVLSISEFNAIIHREIQNQPAPFIYERLGEKYRHFFIDEFQDTSEMQWQNLIPLIDNATSSEIDNEKGTLMIVGDPKQSIYRWRGGKAEQFIELSKAYNPFNNPDKKQFSLDTNWRSYSQVIEFNNDFFEMLAHQFDHSDYHNLYKHHSRQKTNQKAGGYVNISFISKSAKAADDEEITDKMEPHLVATLSAVKKALDQGFHLKDIAILTRKRDQGVAIANYLTENDIAILSSETLMIKNATEVRFIIHLLQFLKNSKDAEAKAFFLQYLAQNVQSGMPVHDFISKGMELENEVGLAHWLSGFDSCKSVFSFHDLRKKSLYETVELIISRFIKPQSSNAYLQYFLDIILDRDVRNQSGIGDFLVYWEKNGDNFSIPSPEGKDAVRILTIHKAKGLEFPVVIMPFAEEDYTRKPKDKMWISSDDENFDLAKVLIDNSSVVESFGEDASILYKMKKQEELLDNINVLYVALTRAEEQLYIISGMNLTSKGEICQNNMSTFFINFLEERGCFDTNISEYTFGLPIKVSVQSTRSELPAVIPTLADILDPGDIKIAQRESLMWGTKQQDAIEYGNIIHEILSFIQTKDDVDLALSKAIENGLIAADDKETVRKTVQEIITHPELGCYYAAGNKILNEQTIIQIDGSPIKPDRMVLAAHKEVYLLDYKTGSHIQKYQQQLQNYQDSIEKMGFRVTKKALVYIGDKVNVVNL
ncbi:MAG TPA: UvrD-helicase domain-containing protein [Flavobacterium sp.]|jgi:ATP-dependent exoDNAse (exonuclease V) beta subunit